MKVLFSILIGVSTLNQAKLIEKLLKEKDFEVEYKYSISINDLNNKDVYGALWFQLATVDYITPIIAPYVMTKKQKAIYVTIEGIPHRSLLTNENLKKLEFIANSNFTKECLEQIGLKVIDVVHHAIDKEKFDEISQYAREQKIKEGNLERKCRLIYVGRHDPRKNLQTLSMAIDVLNEKVPNDFVLRIISDPPAKNLFNKNNCEWIGSFGELSYEEVLKQIALSDYLVFPTISEGFGLPLLEANALGIPAIHCWFPPLSEFSSKDFNFVFDYVDKQLVLNSAPLKDKHVYRQWWVFHIYPLEYLIEMMLYAIDIFKNNKEEYNDFCIKAQDHAFNYDYRIIYPKLLNHLGIK